MPQPTTIDAFSSVASTYEEWFDSPLGAFVDHIEREALSEILRGMETGSVVEVGAGTGHISRWLAEAGSQVTAVEPSQAMRKQGMQRTAGLPIHWHDAYAEEMPFSGESFDGVVFFTTLEFVRRPEDCLHEALRITRPGGWVVAGILHALSAWTALYRYLSDGGVMPWSAGRFFTRKEVEQWMGFPAEKAIPAVYLSPSATAPFEEAELAGKHAGNAPALEILRWRKRS